MDRTYPIIHYKILFKLSEFPATYKKMLEVYELITDMIEICITR